MYELHQSELWCRKVEEDGQGADRLHHFIGCGYPAAGRRSLHIWKAAPAYLHEGTGGDCLWNGDSFLYHSNLFPLRTDGSLPRSFAGNGALHGTDDSVGDWNGGDADCVDLRSFSAVSFAESALYLLSCIMADYHCDAGNLLFLCAQESA